MQAGAPASGTLSCCCYGRFQKNCWAQVVAAAAAALVPQCLPGRLLHLHGSHRMTSSTWEAMGIRLSTYITACFCADIATARYLPMPLVLGKLQNSRHYINI